METPSRCPLCSRSSFELLETVCYENIRYIYKRVLGITVPLDEAPEIQYFRCLTCDLRFFSPAICGDAGFYEELQRRVDTYYLADKGEYRIAQRFVAPNASVLEIGCGAGSFADFLPPGCSYRALEFNGEAIRKARARGLRVDRMRIEELSRSDSSKYDVVCSFQVLEHVGSPDTFLTSAAGLVKQGGRLVVSVPSEESFLKDETNNVLNTPPHHITRWSDAALVNVANLLGLRLEALEHESLSPDHAAAFARARVWGALRRNLGLDVPMVSRAAASLAVRSALYVLVKPLVWSQKLSNQSPFGHSVVAVYTSN